MKKSIIGRSPLETHIERSNIFQYMHFSNECRNFTNNLRMVDNAINLNLIGIKKMADKTAPTPIKGVIYVRYSLALQGDGMSEEAQIIECKKALKKKGCYEPIIKSDKGKSGTTTKHRPGLEDAMSLLEKGSFLVCYSLSRLSRSVKDACEIMERIKDNKAHLITVYENIDTSLTVNEFMFTMFAAIGELEAKTTRDRVRMALKNKQALGHRVGRVGYGYKLDDDGVHLNPNKPELDAIQDIVRYRNMKGKNGKPLSFRVIADILNSDKTYPPARNKTNTWHSSTMKYLYEANQGSYNANDEYSKRKRADMNYKKLQRKWARGEKGGEIVDSDGDDENKDDKIVKEEEDIQTPTEDQTPKDVKTNKNNRKNRIKAKKALRDEQLNKNIEDKEIDAAKGESQTAEDKKKTTDETRSRHDSQESRKKQKKKHQRDRKHHSRKHRKRRSRRHTDSDSDSETETESDSSTYSDSDSDYESSEYSSSSYYDDSDSESSYERRPKKHKKKRYSSKHNKKRHNDDSKKKSTSSEAVKSRESKDTKDG